MKATITITVDIPEHVTYRIDTLDKYLDAIRRDAAKNLRNVESSKVRIKKGR